LTSEKAGADVSGRPKTLEEARLWLKKRLRDRVHPMNLVDPDLASAVIDRIDGLNGESWAAAWGRTADEVRRQAVEAEARAAHSEASALFAKASTLFFLGRFPCPNHPAKERCAEAERETYLAAARYWEIPARRIEVPFEGRAHEGRQVAFYYRRPRTLSKPPVVIMWGGVDAWKEQMTAISDAFLARGVATVALDNVGTGESPVKGVPDGDRQFIPVLDWVAKQEDLEGRRPALLGRSFGGYWATRLAHTCRERISAAVSWGGGAHFMFQPEWIESSRYPDSYLMELVETRMRMLGATNDAEYIDFFRRLSLLDQGTLDQPCAPLLLVNGKFDTQCPVADIHLLTEHGSPKSVRFFPGGHMGLTPQTLPIIVEWVCAQLIRAGAAA
jgi:esterase FrsA